jgi:hypothetical protein
MTRQRSFKERIRARMEKTGESYATARRQLVEKAAAAARKSPAPRSIAPVRKSDEAVLANTGRSWDEWFELLDAWGATEQKHREIARWLVDAHAMDGWWAQTVTVAYEQERGMRAPGQRADGSFSVNASKTIAVALDELFDAFHDEGTRERWLGGPELRVRTARPGKSITADWEDGSTRLSIGFVAKGPDKSQVALAHEKVATAEQADELKAFWRERLKMLKEVLEG